MKVNLTILILSAVVLICFDSCNRSPKNLLASDYIEWANNGENGFVKNKQQQEIVFTTTYRTLPYIIANEQKTNTIEEATYTQRKKELEGMHYFSLRIKSNLGGDVLMHNSNSQEEYLNRVTHYSYDFQNNLLLVENQDTTACKLFNFVRTHGVAPYVDFVFAFPQAKQTVLSDLQLIVEDRVYGNGQLKFLFKKELLNNIPELITQ